jgi:hypothetical protein
MCRGDDQKVWLALTTVNNKNNVGRPLCYSTGAVLPSLKTRSKPVLDDWGYKLGSASLVDWRERIWEWETRANNIA